MAILFTEDFAGFTNGDLLSTSVDWDVGAASGLEAINNAAHGNSGTDSNTVAVATADFPDEQWAQVEIVAHSSFDLFGLILRGSAGNGYLLRSESNGYRLYSMTGWSALTQIGAAIPDVPAVGQVVYAEVRGFDFIVRIDTNQYQFNDGSGLYASGQVGLHYQLDNNNGTHIDNFQAGDFDVPVSNPEITFTGANTLKDIDGNTVNGSFRYSVFDDTGLFSTMTRSTNSGGVIIGLANIVNGEVVLDLGEGSTTGSKVVFFQDDGTGTILKPLRMEAV